MSENMFSRLAAEFPRAQVSWRAQNIKKDGTSALALAYIDARDVMDRLDSVVGPENWSDSYEVHEHVTICSIAIRTPDGWVSKADGAGDTDVEAEKGRLSDALKRAAVHWGIGRYLYAIAAPWVECECDDTGKKDKWDNIVWRWKRWKVDPWSKVKGAANLASRLPPNETPTMPMGDPAEPSLAVADSTAKLIFPAFQNEIQGCATRSQLDGAWDRWMPVIVHWSESMQTNADDVLSQMRDYLKEHSGDARSANREVIEADLRASVSEADLNKKWSGWGPAMKKLAPADVAKLQGVAREVKAAATKPASAATPDFTNLAPNDLDKAVRIAQTP